jgi:predicted nucleic acid-binding protein
MTFAQLPAGATVFLDANTLVYHFAGDPTYGSACTQLLKRVEQQQVAGFTTIHVLADVAHPAYDSRRDEPLRLASGRNCCPAAKTP